MPFHAVRDATLGVPARAQDRSWPVDGRSNNAWLVGHDRRHRARPAAGGADSDLPGAGGRRLDGSSHSADASTLFRARRTSPLIAVLYRQSQRSYRGMRGCLIGRKQRPSLACPGAGPRAKRAPKSASPISSSAPPRHYIATGAEAANPHDWLRSSSLGPREIASWIGENYVAHGLVIFDVTGAT